MISLSSQNLIRSTVIPHLIEVATSASDDSNIELTSCYLKQAFKRDFTPWSIINSNLNAYASKIPGETILGGPSLITTIIRGALRAGIDLVPNEKDLISLKNYLCLYDNQNFCFDEIAGLLKENFPNDIFMSGFIQVIYYEHDKFRSDFPGIMYIGTQGKFIYEDMIQRFISQFRSLNTSQKKMIQSLSIIKRGSTEVVGTISKVNEIDVKIVIGGITMAEEVLFNCINLQKFLDFLQNVRKDVSSCSENKRDEYFYILQKEHGSAPLDRFSHEILIKQGKEGMCKKTTLAMANCGVACLPSSIKMMGDSCACLGPMGKCGEFTLHEITERTPYSYVEETLYAMKKVKNTLVGAGYKTVQEADEETQKEVLKIVKEGRERVARLSLERAAILENRRKELDSKKLDGMIVRMFTQLRVEEVKARVALKDRFLQSRVFLESNASFFDGENTGRQAIEAEASAFFNNPPQDFQRMIRILRLHF